MQQPHCSATHFKQKEVNEMNTFYSWSVILAIEKQLLVELCAQTTWMDGLIDE